MQLISNNDCAIELSDHSSSGDKEKGSTIKPVSTGVLQQSKSASQTCRLSLNSALSQVSAPLNTGFSLVTLEYRRDNQPNDQSSKAIRMRTDSNGGRILEPVRERVSLLSQSFEPKFKTCVSLKLPVTKDGSDYGTFLGKRTCDEQSGMSFA